ncbi:hypothetical Protein YC6258_02317 [Gynuella sunshinyii YC6258]|uniref:Uncharacterized protein n=1 Tax=Gynuella sunshinyii YC6258 TaxID=1445510 RepID=A0A0C5V4F2_9GAMM|nr:hypothetical Protein YC6258_02317 [Gynuella sunshinyii YC6258]
MLGNNGSKYGNLMAAGQIKQQMGGVRLPENYCDGGFFSDDDRSVNN